MAANHATPSGLFEKRARAYTVTSGGGFGVPHQGISSWGHTPQGQRIIDKLAQFKTVGQSLLRRVDTVPALSGAGVEK